VRRSVRSIALLLVCLDWKSDSFSYRTHLPFDSKVATLPEDGSVADRYIPQRGEHVIPYMEGVRADALGQTKLALDDLVNQLYAGQDPPGVEEALESEHRAHAAFYPPVIAF
jgi:hypothetical protein